MTAAPTPMANGSRIELSWGVKALLGASTLLSTIVATGVGTMINNHYTQQQTATAIRQGDIRKLEDQVQAFNTAMRVYVVGLNKNKPSDAARESAISTIEQQYGLLQTLLPLTRNEQERRIVESYRQDLLEVIRKTRSSKDNSSAMQLAQAVSHSVDSRIAAVNVLRDAVGLPVDVPAKDALKPSDAFSSAGGASD